MPIYRVPELSSKPNFDNDHPPQDSRRHHHHHRHRQQQQQHHHQGRVTETRRSSSPGLQLMPDGGDESIVEREIRLQLEKEAEIATLHRALERTFSIDSDELETTETKVGSESEAEAEEEVGRRRSSVATDDERHVIGQYSRAGESLIARELMEQKRREEELRNRHRKIDGGGAEGHVRNPSGEDRVGFDQSLSTKRKSARGAASSSSSEDTRRSHRVQTDAPSGLSGGEGGGGGGLNRPSPPSRSTDLADGRQTEKRRTSMELRIEEEVREARKREKELREQRRLLNTALLTTP